MDVRCERCSTEYEFDDALVSGRGTTVKCTNCGHKFKIRRSDGDFTEDFWNVQTVDGRTLVFTSLRELQRAIQGHVVDRLDRLSRGGLEQKPIGQIPELAPFFDQRDQTQRKGSAAQAISSRPPPPPGASSPPLAPPRPRMSTRPDFPPPAPEQPASYASGKTTLSGGTIVEHPAPAVRPVSAPPPSRRSASLVEAEAAQRAEAEFFETPVVTPVLTEPTEPTAPLYLPKHAPAPPAFEASSPLPPPAPAALRRMNVEEPEEDTRDRSPSFSDSPPSMGTRRSVGGFIVAAVVVAGVALIGVVWAKDHLRGFLGGRSAPVVMTDPRVAGLLASGEKALADGNLETAKESLDKASALAEKDPRVLLDVARLAAVRADIPWLKSRLLVADAVDEHRLTAGDLAELSAAALKAADDALAVAPDDPAALRAKIDALRITGDRAGARALTPKLAPSASQPETAYVLAALDVADTEPLWSTLIERLRVAASAESGPGRARAMLTYALARSGDPAGAKAEVERLAAMPRQHPLLPLLRGFAGRARPAAKTDATNGDAGVVDGGAAAIGIDAGRAAGERTDRADRGDKSHVPIDARQLVSQGEAARSRGDYERAQTLFAAALDRNPNDTEALNGLAAIAHARHDLIGARASYKRVLSVNPSYIPALVGLGDVDWESGDRTSAMKTYKEIVDRFPDGAYPARIRRRLEPAPAPAPAPATSPEPSHEPASGEPGGGG